MGLIFWRTAPTPTTAGLRPGARRWMNWASQSLERRPDLLKKRSVGRKAMNWSFGTSLLCLPCFAILMIKKITKKKFAWYEAEKLLHAMGFAIRSGIRGCGPERQVPPEERKRFFDENFMNAVNESHSKIGFQYGSLDWGLHNGQPEQRLGTRKKKRNRRNYEDLRNCKMEVTSRHFSLRLEEKNKKKRNIKKNLSSSRATKIAVLFCFGL